MHADDEKAEVDAMRRAHRFASDRLEDRPDASVRDTVLAAAARAVGARPALVAPATPADKPFSPPTRHAPRRWPLSAAALLVVSIMTGLIATRILRDGPERITTIASSAPPQRTPDADATKAAPASPAASQAPAQDGPPSPIVDAPRPKAVDREPQRRDAGRSVGRPLDAAPVTPAASAVVEPGPSADVSPERTSASRAKAQAVAPAPDSAGAQGATTPAAAADTRRAESDAFFDATTARNAARARVGRAAEPVTPEAWVERIVKLRADGNDVEAERELDALRRRYPGFEIPADALSRR